MQEIAKMERNYTETYIDCVNITNGFECLLKCSLYGEHDCDDDDLLLRSLV